MTTRVAPWPTQVLLPGQVAAVPGPVDVSRTYLVHYAIRRDLTSFVRVVPATPVSDRISWGALGRRWATLAHVLDRQLGIQDGMVWPALAARLDAVERTMIDAGRRERAEIRRLLLGCGAGFGRMVGDPLTGDRDALAVRLVALREQVERYLRHLEAEVLPLVQRTMDQGEWRALESAYLPAGLGVVATMTTWPWLRHGLPGEFDGLLAAEPGEAHGPALRRIAALRFERRERAAFRHLPMS